jgi:hypothetical protein
MGVGRQFHFLPKEDDIVSTATKRSRKRGPVHSAIHVRGFARIQAGERSPDGRLRIVGDSGWIRNTITNTGRDLYIAATVGAVSGSRQVSHLVLATQSTAVDVTATALVGETRARKQLTSTYLSTGTLRMTASWSSTDNAAAITIGSIGIYNHLTTGTLGSGQSFTTLTQRVSAVMCGALAA